MCWHILLLIELSTSQPLPTTTLSSDFNRVPFGRKQSTHKAPDGIISYVRNISSNNRVINWYTRFSKGVYTVNAFQVCTPFQSARTQWNRKRETPSFACVTYKPVLIPRVTLLITIEICGNIWISPVNSEACSSNRRKHTDSKTSAMSDGSHGNKRTSMKHGPWHDKHIPHKSAILCRCHVSDSVDWYMNVYIGMSSKARIARWKHGEKLRKARNLLSTSDQEYRICESGSSNIRQKRARFPLAETPKNGTRGQNAMNSGKRGNVKGQANPRHPLLRDLLIDLQIWWRRSGIQYDIICQIQYYKFEIATVKSRVNVTQNPYVIKTRAVAVQLGRQGDREY